MAPMTRSFSPGNVPNELNIAYYARRAENGVGAFVQPGVELANDFSWDSFKPEWSGTRRMSVAPR